MSWRSNASCKASEFMTVANMPIWSAVTRSMPWSRPSSLPRQILPPPMTIATCTPMSLTSDHHLRQLFGALGVDAKAAFARQGFAAQLQQDAVILQVSHPASLLIYR